MIMALRLNAQDSSGIWQEAINRFNQKDYHGVIEYMDRFLKQIPGAATALYNRGIAKLNLGDYEAACVDFKAAKDLGFNVDDKFYGWLCDKDYVLKILKKQFYKNTELYADNDYRPHYTRKDTLRGALRPERTCFDVYFYDLEVKIIPKGKKIEGQNDIYFHVMEPTRRIQIDLFDNYTIREISRNGESLKYTREYNAVFVDFPQSLKKGEDQKITIRYSGKPLKAPNPPWDGGFVWKKDDHKNQWVGVACEQLGASSWWPNKDHLTDEPDSMKITIDVPQKYMAVSNGMLRHVSEPEKNYRKYEWFVSYPINNYDVTFYMGKFDYFTDTVDINGKNLLMKYYVLPDNLEKAKEHFKQADEVVKFYSKVFGEYPFMRDGFGLVESPYEGMEHQTAIAYGNGYDNTQDSHSYRNKKYDYIIVHEAAHEWWGNSLTAGDMADVWLHEGFATYAEVLFIENKFGRDDYLYELNQRRQNIFNFWPMVENYNVNENSFASSDVYFKGATLLHCLRCTLNDDSLFFRIIKDYCVENRYKIVTTQSFIDFVNKLSGKDFSAFFDKYLYDTKLPVLKYKFHKENDKLVLTYRWDGVKEGFFMPFAIRTNDNKSIRLEATTHDQTVTLENVKWFDFYNEWQGYEGIADNSFTYFRTSWVRN